MFAGKPIIGLVGGIGSGKSFVASIFGELGCCVISSDELTHRAYGDPIVKKSLQERWGDSVYNSAGELNRAAVAKRVFADSDERKYLEGLLHPLVNQARQRVMEADANNAQVIAFIWDTPLLIETGLDQQCDAVVYIETPEELRQARVLKSRGWDAAEHARREKLQHPLDKKRAISDYVISNTAGADQVRDQVRQVLSWILAGLAPTTGLE
jgi:dephospho-CoA kinase